MRHPTRPEFLQSGSRRTLPNLDTSGSHQNSQISTISNISGIPLTYCSEEISTPLTPTDLRIARQDSWRQLPPALLQTLIECMSRRVAALLRARRGPTRYLAGVQFFWLFSV
ncbi:uncharacterized protein TNCV_181641 [Trichonephila clavipes]|nr:uncharacterized protein TNCV_181641 [Trichonephila clavipes]